MPAVTRVSKFCFVAWLKRPLRLAWTHSSTPLSERFMISPHYRAEREAPASPNADAQCLASHQTRISAPACSGQNPMSTSRYVVVCRHVSPRLLGLTGALRVRQSLVVEIVQRLREKLSIASRCPPWSPRFGLRQHTLANGLSTGQRLPGWARGRSVRAPLRQPARGHN
jgi:hypothetical protein